MPSTPEISAIRTNALPAGTIDRIKAIVGPKGWHDDPAVIERHIVDWMGAYRGRTPLVVFPASTEEVAAVVAVCAETRTVIVPQGGNTSLVGASVPGTRGDEIILNLGRMNAILAIDPLDPSITVQAGCTLAAVQEAALSVDRFFPLSIGSEGVAQIGGNLSTNAGGVQVLRWGMARDLVLDLQVVLPDGTVSGSLKRLRKDNTGYDTKQLFLGAEGTLGIITAAVLRLFPQPRSVETAFVALRDPAAALELLCDLRAATGDAVTAFELMSRSTLDLILRNIPGTRYPLAAPWPWCALVQCSGGEGPGLRTTVEATLAASLDTGAIHDATFAADLAQAKAFWRIRHSVGESRRLEGGSVDCDVSVPVSCVPAAITALSAAQADLSPQDRLSIYGHAGDGNLHVSVLQPAGARDNPHVTAAFRERAPAIVETVYGIVEGFGGSIAAEHGIGASKAARLVRHKSASELALMRSVKQALDPQGIMNPGKILA